MLYEIDESYIKEAVRIRKTYFDVLNKISKLEDDIVVHRKDVDNELKQLKSVDDINETFFNDKLIKIQASIKRTEDIINPYYKTIDDLKDKADKLYESIMSRYPDIDINSVKKQIIDKL